MSDNLFQPLLTVGLPIYNGEKTIEKILDSILNQHFENFILVISDNGSTDSTQKICENYARNDSRINYIRQEKNIGLLNNWNFILKKAKTKYFMWIEADDYYDSSFIEDNIRVLENNDNFVGSISNSIYFDGHDKSPQSINAIGTYEEKSRTYLKFNRGTAIFAIYRTNSFQKSIVYGEYGAWDLRIMINILKFGDLNVINKIQHYKSAKGISSKSYLKYMLNNKINFFRIIIPYMPVTSLCIKKFGFTFFFKNFILFLRLNSNGTLFMTRDIFKFCKNYLINRK
jgi:glycosyltransferase involved in cell wall biosynthesis